MDEEIEELEKNNSYYFVTDKYNRDREIEIAEKILLSQICINIREKQLKGINMNVTKNVLRKYTMGLKTKETIELYNELLVEANAQLGLLRLDNSFRKYEDKIKDVIKDNFKNIYGEDIEKMYKNTIIKMYNQVKGIDPYIIKDGSEPEIRQSDFQSKQKKLLDLPAIILNDIDKKKQDEKIIKDIELSLNTDVLNADERQRLILVKDIKSKLMNQQLVDKNSLTVDLIDNKSVEELKSLDIEEVGKYDFKLDDDGNIKTSSLFENNQIDKINKDLSLIPTKESDNMSSLLPEKKFEENYKTIVKRLKKEDKERSEKIVSALMKGEYIDDPIYIELLLTDEKFLKLREKFLKEYYSGKSKLDKKTLLIKYLDIGGNVIENMNLDGAFYDYDTESGKKLSKMFYEYIAEINKEEDFVEDPSRLDTYDIEEEEQDEEKHTLQSLIMENMKDLQDGQKTFKSIYDDMTNITNIDTNAVKPDKNYKPGRNKKLKYKH